MVIKLESASSLPSALSFHRSLLSLSWVTTVSCSLVSPASVHVLALSTWPTQLLFQARNSSASSLPARPALSHTHARAHAHTLLPPRAHAHTLLPNSYTLNDSYLCAREKPDLVPWCLQRRWHRVSLNYLLPSLCVFYLLLPTLMLCSHTSPVMPLPPQGLHRLPGSLFIQFPPPGTLPLTPRPQGRLPNSLILRAWAHCHSSGKPFHDIAN